MNIHNYMAPLVSSKKLILSFFVLLSILLAAYGPMASYAGAQAVADKNLKEVKNKAVKELDRRITNYKKTLESLKADYTFGKDGASGSFTIDKTSALSKVDKNSAEASVESDKIGTSSFKFGKNGLEGQVALPDGLQDKVKQFMEKMIEQLMGLKDKVLGATSMGGIGGMDSLTKNIDSQFGLDQLTQVQGQVTQAIESMTGVLDGLKTTFNDLQSQVTKLKDCAKGLKDGETTVSGEASTESAGVSCGDFNLSSADIGDQAQSQLDSLSSITTTIAGVLASSVTLLMSLVTSFTGLLGGMGGLGSLGNLGSLSSMLDPSQLGNLTGSLGSITGMLGSFSAITSQLDIAGGMGGNSLNSLSSLTSLINLPI